MSRRLNHWIERHQSGTLFLLFGGICAVTLFAFHREADDRRENICTEINQINATVTEIVLLSFNREGGSGVNLTFPPHYEQIEDPAVRAHFKAIQDALNNADTPSQREEVLNAYVEKNLQPKDC